MSDSAETPRILLIGVGGQVGWELRRSLAPLGELVTAGRTGEGVLPVDLADGDRIRTVVREVRPALIVNAAAYTAVDQAEREPDVAHAVNAVAPGILQEEANRLGAAVVHFSTDYVFDGSGSTPWEETDPTGPLGIYGRTKLAGEQAIATAGGAYLILRTSWVYGARGVNFVKKILKLATERETLRIVADQIGAPTSARFLADVTAKMVASDRIRRQSGIVHVAPSGETSWHGFACEFIGRARNAGMKLAATKVLPIATSEFPTPARRPRNSRLNCRRLREEYGIAQPSWQDVLSETLPELLRYEFGIG